MIISIIHYAVLFNLAAAASDGTNHSLLVDNNNNHQHHRNLAGCNDYNGDKWGCQSAGTGAECTYNNKSKVCSGDLGPPPTPPPITPSPTPNPTTAQPTNAPTTAQPTNVPTTAQPTNEPTNAPTTAQPTNAPTTAKPTNAPTTSQPTTPGMGYCSHNPAMQCSSIDDCNGCQADGTRLLLLRSSSSNNDRTNKNNNLRWKNNKKEEQLYNHRTKPKCNDGTCRKTCGDCAPTDPECDSNHPQTCLAPPPTPPPTTANPTPLPTTANPTSQPTNAPTNVPTNAPTNMPTTSQPTEAPTPCDCLGLPEPTNPPSTAQPTSPPSSSPTPAPTNEPTPSPTNVPTTAEPTNAPTTAQPTNEPTNAPTTAQPTNAPVTVQPTPNPTLPPTPAPTNEPTPAPSNPPTPAPTKFPTNNPTSAPTNDPTANPTSQPTQNPTKTPTTSPNNGVIQGEVDVPIVPHASNALVVSLPSSTTNRLLTVSQVSNDNGDAVPVARSYDGYDYETLHPLLLAVDCVGGSCSVGIPPNTSGTVVHYIIKEYNPAASTDVEEKARLLLQGTFGPNQSSLDEAVALATPEAWVQDQMAKPETSLRSHYRQRANGHIRTNLHHHGTRGACEAGSRWVRHAFNRWRDIGKVIEEVPTGTGSFYLKVDGIARTEVPAAPSVEFSLPSNSYVICRSVQPSNWPMPAYLKMSSFVQAPTGEKGTLTVAIDASSCMTSPIAIDMPAVSFSNDANIPSANLQDLSDENVLGAKILNDVVSPSTCDDFKKTWPNFVKDFSTGIVYVEDRRAELYDNTNGATTQKSQLLSSRCPRVDKSFLNEDTCVIRSDCSPGYFSGSFELNAQNIRKFYEMDEKYVYRIENLPLLPGVTLSPCVSNNNRFVRKDAGGDTTNGCQEDTSGIFPQVSAAIEAYLSTLTPSDQEKKRVIDLSESISCTDANDVALGASFTVTIPGSSTPSCWTHSYQYEWSVMVMNDWVANHPGNPSRHRGSEPNPIAHVAEQENTSGNLEESVTLRYPSWGFHQWNFHNNRWRFERDLLGSWGDSVQFNDLPDTAKSTTVITDPANGLGGSLVAESGRLIEVCSSPGEVSNSPIRGHQYYLQKFGDSDEELPDTLDQDHYRWHSNKMIWNTVAVNAPDQLRQRVAWALSSIFVVTETDIAMEELSEAWGTWHDIFVRNAFTPSFFQLLKEVSFSPMMGKMLTYEGSKSLAYQIEVNDAIFPDENYAREIMQLFSIGLYWLNKDGTYKIDPETGNPLETYTNDDITNFSRAWTNFILNFNDRDNIEPEWETTWVANRIDPMVLPTTEGRDLFPKQTLLIDGKRGYIGDQVQRCDALPDKPWLQKGATWEYRKNSLSVMGKRDPEWWGDDYTWTNRIILQPTTSLLYEKLCNANNVTGECEWQSTVVLDAPIECDGSCNAGQSLWDGTAAPTNPCECSVDLPRTVEIQLSPEQGSIFYEYKPEPCIQMAYPEVVNTVKEIGYDAFAGKYAYGSDAMCADSRLAVAGTTCCDAGGNPVNICVFRGERTTYQTAVDRCENYGVGYSTCAWDTVTPNWSCGSDVDYYQGDWNPNTSPGMRFSWNSAPCSLSSQIDRFGNVAIVHEVDGNTVKERVGVDTGTYFGVFWEGEAFPTASSSCDSIPTCQVQGDTCLCSASVTTIHVYDGSTQVPPTSSTQLLSDLHIGAPNPKDDQRYTLCTAPLCTQSEYDIYSLVNVVDDSNYPSAFDKDTIFEVQHPSTGLPIFLSNSKSTVNVGGGYSFRNPPQYNSPIDPTQRDGLYETDAILSGYANHPNVAPFISKKLIQSLVTSNPSPRYVETVAGAFTSGTYSSGGVTFGSGGHGDLEATIAAIMLDQEARSSTLDDDGNHGRSREALLKNIHLMRSMELSTASGAPREIDSVYLMERGLGEEAFRAPSVFSFFLSDYAPVGMVMNKGLVAPETQLYDAPKLISQVNGLFSMPMFGLTDCVWRQGFGSELAKYWLPDYPDAGMFDCSNANSNLAQLQFQWRPPSWGGQTNVASATPSMVIDDIDILLTGGKLYSTSRAILEQVYSDALAAGDDISALNAVLQHYSAVPEFHITNNLVDSASSATTVRDVPNITIPTNPPPVEGYKAIVYLYMAGAADSYSMLVPTSGCGTLYDDYRSIRGDVALPLDPNKFQEPLLYPLPISIDASTSNQPCNSFGLHPSLANVHSLFGNGDASWVANIGPLVEPLNALEFDAGSKPTPQALFAHNTQTSVTQSVFSQDSTVGGVLGRIGDSLNEQAGEEIFDAYSISGTPKILEGAPGVSRVPDVLSGYGVSSFNYLVTPTYEDNIEALSQNIVTSIFGETYSASMTNAIYRMRLLDGVVGETELVGDACFDNLNTDIANQLWQVARMTNNRDGLNAKRDVFYAQIGGFDTHSDNHEILASLLTQIDDAIGCFKTEMDNQLIWNNVTVISASEFGRTMTSNGLGTDHAWGGNHFILGGSVKGGIIHGQYPNDLTDSGELSIGRGRIIPSTPWEGLWNGLSEWFGVSQENMANVLPNKNNFQTNIFSESDLFV